MPGLVFCQDSLARLKDFFERNLFQREQLLFGQVLEQGHFFQADYFFNIRKHFIPLIAAITLLPLNYNYIIP